MFASAHKNTTAETEKAQKHVYVCNMVVFCAIN